MSKMLMDICFYVKDRIKADCLTNKTYVSTENMLQNRGGIIDSSNVPSIGSVQAFKKGDILVSNIRPYFKKIWFATFDGGCSQDVLVFRANVKTDPEYLYMVLSDDKFFDYAMSSAKGTKMPRGDKEMLLKYSVPDYDFIMQKQLSKILWSIMHKIDINNKINVCLQQHAQALFDEWFIYNKDSNNWKTGMVGDLIDDTIGGDWGKEGPTGNNTQKVYCIRGADIPDVKQGNRGKMPTRYILPKNYSKKKLHDGDLVVEISGGSPTQSTGRVAFISETLLNRYDEGLICTNFCRAVTPKSEYSMYLYHYWQYCYNRGLFFNFENGTTGIKNFDLTGFTTNYEIKLPDIELVRKYNNVCKALYDKIYTIGLENERLSNLKDTLLPKLMNGEIDVSNIKIDL